MILSKASKQNIILFAAAFLLCGLLRVLLYAKDFTFSFSPLFCGVLTLLWAISVRKRVTDGRLRVALLVTGALPQTEPQKHIVAVAIHECMTNTVRHAHGDELQIRVAEGEKRTVVTFANNGEAPAGRIEEKGGLSSLRELTEKAGGTMTVCTGPSFAIRLELPKEVENAL